MLLRVSRVTATEFATTSTVSITIVGSALEVPDSSKTLICGVDVGLQAFPILILVHFRTTG